MSKQQALYVLYLTIIPLQAFGYPPKNVDERWQQAPTVTHPDSAFYPNSSSDVQENRKNFFDWRTQHWQVGMANVSGRDEFIVSPFYICDADSLYNIPGGKVLTRDIMGPGNVSKPPTQCVYPKENSYLDKVPDMNPDEGWEIVKFNLGYKMSHYKSDKESWSADGSDAYSTNEYPYVILYNRLTAKLRVMAYLKGYSIGTGLSVRLSTSDKTRIFSDNLSSDTNFFNDNVTGFGAINNSVDGGWGVVDFNINLDICSPGKDINLNIELKPNSIAELELYGHSIGTSENITDEGIGDPKKFLLNVSGDLNEELNNAGSFTVSNIERLDELFNHVNDSSTSYAVSSGALNSASNFLSGMMELTPETSSVTNGLRSLAGVFGGVGALMGTDAAAVSNYSPIIPQLAFSEIYLRGESKMSDVGVTVKLTLPGSLSTVWKEFDDNATSNISYPLYDEPLGLFTLLTTPKVKVTKSYSDRSNKNGYKLTTSFEVGNVVLAYNSKSGILFNADKDVNNKEVAVTGRLKIKYVVDANIYPEFSGLHDIDGDDSKYNYVDNKTNDRPTHIYTVLSNDVPLMKLHQLLSKDIPSISINGGTAVVESVSLIVTAKNKSQEIHDYILGKDIKLIKKVDYNGKLVPYYITMKEYPASFNENNVTQFDPNYSINRLIETKQIDIDKNDEDQGVQIALGQADAPSIKGYCSSYGDYYKYKDNGPDVIVADEDMSYYTYKPKQVSGPSSDHMTLRTDSCWSCAHSTTFGFLSFNLNEVVGRYGFKKPKTVTLVLYSKQGLPGYLYKLYDYSRKYLFSANIATSSMIANDWGASRPAYATVLKDFINVSEAHIDVTEQFNESLSRVKNNGGEYDVPRLSFALSDYYPQAPDYPWIWTSDSVNSQPKLLVQY